MGRERERERERIGRRRRRRRSEEGGVQCSAGGQRRRGRVG